MMEKEIVSYEQMENIPDLITLVILDIFPHWFTINDFVHT